MTPAAVGLGQVCRRGVSVAARSSDTTSSDTAGHPGGSGGGAPPKLLQRAAAALCAAAMVLAPMPGVPNGLLDPAIAADVGKVGTCLLSKCQGALARCLADGPCLQNLVCLNLCNGNPDEAGCQVKCGDQYGDKAIDAFNSCALSEQKCVPKRIDEDLYPVPPVEALDKAFDISGFTGRWYITAGLNPLFDTFDCQEHFFVNPEPDKISAQINWRIKKPNGDFSERSTIQDFVQDSSQPAILYNHDNEFLHYEDDWYILGSKPDEYIFIYYRGNNDAWKGYGGATVYTRERQLPQELVPELTEVAKGANLKWSDFTITDNTCGPHPPPKPLLKAVEAEAERVEAAAEMQLRSFGRGFTVFEDRLASELLAEEKELAKDLREFEQLLEKAEKEAAAKLLEEEELVVNGLQGFFNKVASLFTRSS
ncbi:hypothetical protein MNEG_3176 [Monoraphidium neglectum]|uniref:VDE lipocalin domain-containing protein n=1 Tax=Monoraphidium neglectum TaxID=145388 RepID=A0A0D2MWC9_9CHLO|nr:hypothetical protein MNEG_3176 [Monoraphidium neglectum]KIZ04782.1 hypothetical protein MNEG_3176 [Monoraphidium neglectum]|eukprot:XP_013903801.1 hypothetical protein MNEG_3176 [Monoraphidium neglectum]